MTFRDVVSLFQGFQGDVSPMFQFDLLGFAFIVCIATILLALRAIGASGKARATLAEAEAKLGAAQELAAEVRGLRAEIAQSMSQHNHAVEEALRLHSAMSDDHGHDDHEEENDDHAHHQHEHTEIAMSDQHDDHDDEHDGHHDDEDDHHHHASNGIFKGMFGRRARA